MTGAQPEDVSFSALSARSKPLVIGVSIAIVVESLAVHVLIVQRYPWLALILWLTNIYTIWWLVRDYRMVESRPTLLRQDDAIVGIGKRLRGAVPYAIMESVLQPSWQERPGPTTPEYVKLSGTGDPNVLIRLREPYTFIGPMGIRKSGRLIGLEIDDPGGFVRAVNAKIARQEG
jgi:hypothetical protein